MQRRLILLAIAVIAMMVAVGFVAMQPDRLSETGSSKPAANSEALKPAANAETAKPQVHVETAKPLAADTGVTVGKRLPGFTLTALDGKPTSVTAGGEIIVLNFWATWCPPCREEMPELNLFALKYGSKLGFYAINIEEPADQVAQFMSKHALTMNVLLDKDGAVAKTFRINAIPTTLVIDKEGVIKYRKSGAVTLTELEGVLNGL